jgi:DNA-binding SARP family transcriptional activator
LIRLKIHLLGAPLIEKDDSPVEFDTRKGTALLAYLAVTDEPATRDGVAALLWPEYDQSRAKAALRRTLSTVRKGIGDEFIRASHTSITLLQDSSVWVDVLAFKDLLAEARSHKHPRGSVCTHCLQNLVEAEAIYRDDFLSGFGLRDSVEFDDWQFFLSEEYRRDLAWTF